MFLLEILFGSAPGILAGFREEIIDDPFPGGIRGAFNNRRVCRVPRRQWRKRRRQNILRNGNGLIDERRYSNGIIDYVPRDGRLSPHSHNLLGT